jgi:hypothetical protein
MKKNQNNWAYPMTGALLCATAASAQQDQQVYLDPTNRLTLSLRFGLNISGKVKGIGTGLNAFSPNGNPRTTPHGDPYNYDNGYVYPDISGSHDGQTWYWGYDSASQVNLANDTITFDRTTANGIPSEESGDTDLSPGFELTYNRELGVKENWHHLRYGVETAVNYMPISFNVDGVFNETLTLVSTPYSFTAGTTPPGYNQPSELPYQGSYEGPGFVIGSTPSGASTMTPLPGATLLVQDNFDFNLWGFRLGPYVEIPFGKKDQFNLHLSAGLAAGLLDASASWQETYTVPNGGGSTIASGGGNDLSVLWGGYVGFDAAYQISERWGVAAGVQFQDLGTYDHNFGGRTEELDLSRSVFVKVGVSYSF